MNPLRFLVVLITRPVHRLEYDPVVQFKFNFFFTWFWFLTMVAAAILTPKHTSVEIVAFLVLMVSLWANFISHLGALGANISAIYAANRQQEIPGLEKTEEHRRVFNEEQVIEIVTQVLEPGEGAG